MKVLLLAYNKFNIAQELKKINVTDFAYNKFNAKATHFVFLIKQMSPAIANIIKQESLLVGADLAISKNAYYIEKGESDGLLLITLDQLKKLKNRIKYQPPKIRAVVDEAYNLIKKIQRKQSILLKDNTPYFFNKTRIMGILNVTPDSFSDGGLYLSEDKALIHAKELLKNGADIIDIGGESSRPGSLPVPANEEINRVLPIIKKLKQKTKKPISLDTYKPEVALAGLNNGVDIINDIYALRYSKEMVHIVKDFNVPVILMHMKGTPKNMQKNPVYMDVVKEIIDFFAERIEYCLHHGISEQKIIIDPGIGFGKTTEHNITILQNIYAFKTLGVPVLIGASRKTFIGNILKIQNPRERLYGTLATSAYLYNKVEIIRIHDVKQHKHLFKILDKLE